ncbi:hypothetical protein O6H91_03G030800 [Diphasiastrum complanatum]|uniref:Uncharacterized protein n=1 Tax=Diphasiastrum complanatum TaxID=34168 RepID=A0ACC2E510_DIPCM|nr:hypothetical protein O6H91_03G030800 [Diphasiastrum complanatum]
MAMETRSFLFLVMFLQWALLLCDGTALSLRYPSDKGSIIPELEGYEIRRYNASIWVSTAPILDTSFESATRGGFFRLFNYIDGSNFEHRKIAMTAPVLTGVVPSSGPVCASAFIVRFFFSESSSHEYPPIPESKLNLNIERWSSRCFAVRTFSGFATDENVPQEAYSLLRSLAGSPWAGISKSESRATSETYTIAQYNSPFDVIERVNEVWFNIETSRADCQLKPSQL